MKYTLDKRLGKKKHTCPSCGHLRKFTRYIHIETFEELHDNVGICDRRDNCQYHYHPNDYLKDNPELKENFKVPIFKPRKSEPVIPDFIDFKYFHDSMNSSYSKNYFFKHLEKLFGNDLASKLCQAYCVGNSSLWTGANVFWQMDSNLNIRHGQITLYHHDRFNRKKYNNSVQEKLKEKQLIKGIFKLVQSFNGEHLVKYNPDLPIAIVESVKTAIIMTMYLPDFLWIAASGAYGLNISKFEALKGREITLFPDLNKFELWSKKAAEIGRSLGLKINVSDYLEKNTDPVDISEGYDLADYVLRTDETGKAVNLEGETIWKFTLLDPLKSIFNQLNHAETINSEQDIEEYEEPDPAYLFARSPVMESVMVETIEKVTKNWNSEIEELENFFKAAKIPDHSIILQPCNKINDVSSCIESHLEALKFNNGNKIFLPFLNRLNELKRLLDNIR